MSAQALGCLHATNKTAMPKLQVDNYGLPHEVKATDVPTSYFLKSVVFEILAYRQPVSFLLISAVRLPRSSVRPFDTNGEKKKSVEKIRHKSAKSLVVCCSSK